MYSDRMRAGFIERLNEELRKIQATREGSMRTINILLGGDDGLGEALDEREMEIRRRIGIFEDAMGKTITPAERELKNEILPQAQPTRSRKTFPQADTTEEEKRRSREQFMRDLGTSK